MPVLLGKRGYLTGLQVYLFHSALMKSVLLLLFKSRCQKKGFPWSFQLGGNLYLIFVLVTHVQQSVSGPMSDETASPFKLLLALLFVLLCTLCNRPLWKDTRRATPQGGKSSFSFDVLMGVWTLFIGKYLRYRYKLVKVYISLQHRCIVVKC